ncbi:MAG: zinc-dependent metalloprotease [Rubrivivax sp.]|nr:zinc-dependent metalloprotease [Rubrivivax sp.]
MASCSALAPPGGNAPAKPVAAPGAGPAAPAAAAPATSPAPRPAGQPQATPTPQPPGAPGAAPAAGPPPGGPPPFATVIKDARRIDGAITAWQKDDKVWFELRPEQLGQPFLFAPKIRTGIGEGLTLAGLMTYPSAGAGGPQVVEFVRVHNTIRMQARNTDVFAKPGTPEALGLASSYSASLLAAVPVASQPHPDRKSVLIDAAPLVLNDVAAIGLQLQRQFRQGYSLDRGNSVVTAVRGDERALIVETQTHWFTGSVSVGAPTSPLAALVGAPAPSVPRWVPDTRSFLIGMHLSFTALPAQPMSTRRADGRVGLFTTRVLDFSDELTRTPVRRYINRWRLEKKDPKAELSEPVKPITFWIDRNVPHAYRETVRAAVLEWNKAFERIGFQNALRVEQQPDDAKFDTLDPGYASVRWLMSAEPVITAIGQTHTDPRTGEILDADVSFEGLFTRFQRYFRTQLIASTVDASAEGATRTARAPFADPPVLPGLLPGRAEDGHDHGLFCRHGDLMAEQARYALDVMEARGQLEPGSPLAQQFVLDYLKDTLMHEVGHALGLRHNFRASRVYTEAQLADPEFTRANGTTGSVMEYNAVNLAAPGQKGGVPFQTTIGPYDYWAIEYAYKPVPPEAKPGDEEAMLQAIAGRSADPLLAFGTDEDAAFGIDAETIQFDLGADPLAFASKRLAIARDLFQRQETRELPPEANYAVLRRSLAYALGDATQALGVLVRQLGGLRTLRDHPGSGRDPITPVPTEVQRQAFDTIARAVFSAEGFRVSPALQRRLAPDYLDRGEIPGLPTDFNVPQRLLDLQRAALAYLMSDALAVRLLDANQKLDPGADRFELHEIHERLSRDLWTELAAGSPIEQPRRELQRDHVNRLAFAVLRPTPGAKADARGGLRKQAEALLARIDAVLAPRKGRPALDEATRLHLADSADSLRQALKSQLPRAGI